MPKSGAGGFEFRGDVYGFDEARCRWIPGDLYIKAAGDCCFLGLIGVPLPGVYEIADLPGRIWAQGFVEAGLEISDESFRVTHGWIEFREFDNDRGILTLDFLLEVEDGEEEIDGVVHCRVITPDEGALGLAAPGR